MNLTSLLKQVYFDRIIRDSMAYSTLDGIELTQRVLLKRLVAKGKKTLWGVEKRLDRVKSYEDFAAIHPQPGDYTIFRPYVMKMVDGQQDILWPGKTINFAQSSGTSDGKSKYIPITPDSFKFSHYRGGAAVIANYLNIYPDSRLFSGKSFILGGSFANELSLRHGVRVGDLSANLIANINPLANIVRIPNKKVALMEDWTKKLPALVDASINKNVTNISGVPSWFMTVIKEIIKKAGATTIHDVWPNLEVFFHGGISIKPYRELYDHLTDKTRMRYLETYNASEGFFGVQNDIEDNAMLLLLDAGTFYEFLPLEQNGNENTSPLPAWKLEQGKIYSLIITSCNGLWRYSIGDTVKVESLAPLKITIAGRTKHYINVFGEEVMVYNTDSALANVCQAYHCQAVNYTVAPVFSTDKTHGRHQWLIEFSAPPADIKSFASDLDLELRKLNSDYDAKRQGDLFLDNLTITVASQGIFDKWLATTGKLGGQRKIPRLYNDRHIIDNILQLMK